MNSLSSSLNKQIRNASELFHTRLTARLCVAFEGRQTMNPSGVGLGLNIAYKLVQFLAPINHQNIQVISIPNKGLTLSFILESKSSCPSTLLEEFGREMTESNSDNIADELSGDKKLISLPKLQGVGQLISKESETEPIAAQES